MTLEELLEMPLGTSKWVEKTFTDIIRVPGGWVYSLWNPHTDSPVTATFVPEPERRE